MKMNKIYFFGWNPPSIKAMIVTGDEVEEERLPGYMG